MIKVGNLEKQDKQKSKKKTKIERHKMSEETKPKKTTKISFRVSKPTKKYTE